MRLRLLRLTINVIDRALLVMLWLRWQAAFRAAYMRGGGRDYRRESEIKQRLRRRNRSGYDVTAIWTVFFREMTVRSKKDGGPK